VSALYLDASALVKLVQLEAESAALRGYLDAYPAERRVTSVLSRTEVVRAVWAGGPPAVRHALTVVERTEQVAMTHTVLDQAATLLPGIRLRTLDAIHLASALALGSELRTLVTYDVRLVAAAAALGLGSSSPG
jgi:predicted nucleic acid-binding protein